MSDLTLDKSEMLTSSIEDAPDCGLYIVLPPTYDHEKQGFQLGQALHAANRFSKYSLNRHIVEFRPNPESPEPFQIAKSYQEISHRNGFIFLVYDNPELARSVGADGILCSSLNTATLSRKLLDENSIIGLRCSTLDMAKSASQHELDFITIYTEKNGTPLLDILNWWVMSTDNLIAVEGFFDPENCQNFVKAGANFIDSAHHIWTHPSGNPMQGTVNMLDAFERHKTIQKKLN
jgi:thiamine monophosphate synthase